MYKIFEVVTVNMLAEGLSAAERDGYTYVGTVANPGNSIVIMHKRQGEERKQSERCKKALKRQGRIDYTEGEPRWHLNKCRRRGSLHPLGWADCSEDCQEARAAIEEQQGPDLMDLSLDEWAAIASLLREAVITDGAYHRQWYLEQIAERLKVSLPEHDEGIPA